MGIYFGNAKVDGGSDGLPPGGTKGQVLVKTSGFDGDVNWEDLPTGGLNGNPIGTIISYMGVITPRDYLVCDGSEYNIGDYPALSAHFAAQFGSINYFGGDGVNTFAVPDMRNLFLRGYHGEAEEQLSGDVGIRQEATRIPYLAFGINSVDDSCLWGNYNRVIRNDTDVITAQYADAEYEESRSVNVRYFANGTKNNDVSHMPNFLASRPFNMAVLYCIKATESTSTDFYSTEEQAIGKWIDGKTLYRKIINDITGKDGVTIPIPLGLTADTVILAKAFIYKSNNTNVFVPDRYCEIGSDRTAMYVTHIGETTYVQRPITLIVEYTKP